MTEFLIGLGIGLLVGWAIPQPAFVKEYEGKFFAWLFAWIQSKAVTVNTTPINEPTANTDPVANNAPNT
jgi:hypothetical protein